MDVSATVSDPKVYKVESTKYLDIRFHNTYFHIGEKACVNKNLIKCIDIFELKRTDYYIIIIILLYYSIILLYYSIIIIIILLLYYCYYYYSINSFSAMKFLFKYEV